MSTDYMDAVSAYISDYGAPILDVLNCEFIITNCYLDIFVHLCVCPPALLAAVAGRRCTLSFACRVAITVLRGSYHHAARECGDAVDIPFINDYGEFILNLLSDLYSFSF